MRPIDDNQVAELLAQASGPVSYQSHYARTTAVVDNGRWTSKQMAYKYLQGLLDAERKAREDAERAAYVPPKVSGARSLPYAGPFPRGRHSHRCKGCELRNGQGAVACYKSKCTKPQLVAECEWCRGRNGR